MGLIDEIFDITKLGLFIQNIQGGNRGVLHFYKLTRIHAKLLFKTFSEIF